MEFPHHSHKGEKCGFQGPRRSQGPRKHLGFPVGAPGRTQPGSRGEPEGKAGLITKTETQPPAGSFPGWVHVLCLPSAHPSEGEANPFWRNVTPPRASAMCYSRASHLFKSYQAKQEAEPRAQTDSRNRLAGDLGVRSRTPSLTSLGAETFSRRRAL